MLQQALRRAVRHPTFQNSFQRNGPYLIQQRECANITIGIIGIIFASIGIKVLIYKSTRENNVRLFKDLTSIDERLDILTKKSGKTLNTNLKTILGQGIDETDIGMLGIFTGKAKPSVADQVRLKKLCLDLRPQISSSEKVLKQDILAHLNDEKLPVIVKERLKDYCSRSYIQNEDEFLGILKAVLPAIPEECSILKIDVEQLIELMHIRHSVLDPLIQLGTKGLVVGGKQKVF